MATKYREKVAKKMGIDPKQVDLKTLDRTEFLRAQGYMQSKEKEQQAKNSKEAMFREQHTFNPDTRLSKKKSVTKIEPVERTSIGSINLDGIAKKRGSKFDKLYNQRKRQIDKTEKSSEDYYFEKAQAELTFQPNLPTKGKSDYLKSVVPGAKTKTELKQIERMRLAREERLKKNAMFERGEPVIEKKYQHSNIDRRSISKQASMHTISQVSEVEKGTKTRGFKMEDNKDPVSLNFDRG